MTTTLSRQRAHAPAQTFAALGVPPRIEQILTDLGKTEPFPIQRDTLPDTLRGRDVLGRGRTGSGKTLAFAIPLVTRIGENRAAQTQQGQPSGLVLAPTRELATQIAEVITPLAESYGLRVTTIFGGVKQQRQVNALRAGVDIVVACPGRLEDLIGQRHISLERVEITVLDEADHMADLGFLPGVTRILAQTPRGGQRMLFSATLDNGVNKLVKRFLHEPVEHSVDAENSPVVDMTHHVFEVKNDQKREVVAKLASGTGRRVLFTRTKHQAKKLAKSLTGQGIPAVDLHGNLSQAARDRNLAAFGDGRVNVLVATDVAARGVHVDNIELVVHVDPPMEHKAYLHRSGRTARAGASGDVVTVMLREQRRDTQALLRKAGIKVEPVAVAPNSREVQKVTGEVADFVEPGTVVVAPAQGSGRPPGSGRSQGANAQRKRATRAARGGQNSGRRQGAGAGRSSGSGQSRHSGGEAARSGNGSRRRQAGQGSRRRSAGRAHSAR